MNKFLITAVMLVLFTACDKQIDKIRPLIKIDKEGELNSVAGIKEATAGNYLLLRGDDRSDSYSTPFENVSESRGNNVALRQHDLVSQPTDAFFYQNSPAETLGYSASIYRGAYRIIVSINAALEGIAKLETQFGSLTDNDKNNLRYAKGENIFLRAFTYFNLTRLFGKPFYQNPQTSLSVPLKKSSDIEDNPQRATVKEIYDFIVPELKMAAQLMKAPVSKTNSFASTGAAWALLSRIYLYMGGTFTAPNEDYNKQVVLYADSVILWSKGKYALREGADYMQMFGDDESGKLKRSVFNTNKEIIFAYDNAAGGNSIGKLYHYDVSVTSSINGLFKPSVDFMRILDPNDIRRDFLKENLNSKSLETTKWLAANRSLLTFAPQIFFRLGEIYLNRAEAYAKLKNYAAGRADLKAIHTRAGLPATDVDNIPDSELLKAVLKERRIELAFEGHIGYDYFRNGLPMKRIAEDNNGAELIIQPDDQRVVFNIPAF